MSADSFAGDEADKAHPKNITYESTVIHDETDLARQVEDFISTETIRALFLERMERLQPPIPPTASAMALEVGEDDEEDDGRNDEFKMDENPSSHIWKNQFAETILDPVRSKKRYVATFIVEELMEDFIKQVYKMIDLSATERAKAARKIIHGNTSPPENMSSPDCNSLAGDDTPKTDQDDSINSSQVMATRSRRKLKLKGNTAIQALRKMFQSKTGTESQKEVIIGEDVEIDLENENDDDEEEEEDEDQLAFDANSSDMASSSQSDGESA